MISTLTLSALILLATHLFLRSREAIPANPDLLRIGLLWLGLTVVFEFVFGHYVMGQPWERLLADYNIFKGRIWVLVLLVTGGAPLLVGWLQRR